MLPTALIATAGLLSIACVLVFRTRKLLSNQKLRQAWLRFTCLLVIVTSIVVFLGISTLVFSETLVFGLYLLPPCFAALCLSLSLLTRKTLKHLRHLYQRDGIGIFDKVTNVHNRYYLEQRLEAEIARSNRYNTPLALLSVEVNDFESLSDEYSHQAGDMAAIVVAEALKNTLRDTDVITRYYPGCFLVILPDTPERNVNSLITRLENTLNDLIVIKGSDTESSIRISVSFGISTCTLATSNALELIEKSVGLSRNNVNRIQTGKTSRALSEGNFELI